MREDLCVILPLSEGCERLIKQNKFLIKQAAKCMQVLPAGQTQLFHSPLSL